MNNSLSISTSEVPENADAKAMKKEAKKAAKKAVGHHHPKKHVGPGHEHKDKHEPQADRRRAYLHLARVTSLLAGIPQNDALNELNKLYSLYKKLFDADHTSSKAVAECARALEHLSFVSLAAVRPSSSPAHPLKKKLKRDFAELFQHDFEKQKERLEEADALFSQPDDDQQSTASALLDLAQHSLETAERMIQKENWYLAHECLRATDAITKAVDHL
jgi:hypothetical protein